MTGTTVFRVRDSHTSRLLRVLAAEGIRGEIERYGPAVYLVVASTRHDVTTLVTGSDRGAVLVPSLDQLASALEE